MFCALCSKILVFGVYNLRLTADNHKYPMTLECCFSCHSVKITSSALFHWAWFITPVRKMEWQYITLTTWPLSPAYLSLSLSCSACVCMCVCYIAPEREPNTSEWVIAGIPVATLTKWASKFMTPTSSQHWPGDRGDLYLTRVWGRRKAWGLWGICKARNGHDVNVWVRG